MAIPCFIPWLDVPYSWIGRSLRNWAFWFPSVKLGSATYWHLKCWLISPEMNWLLSHHEIFVSWASCQIRKTAGCACKGKVFPPPWVSYHDVHHGTCVTQMPWCMPGSLTSGFHWSRWQGKRSWHSRRMRHPQFYVSGKRPMELYISTNIVSKPID